MDMMGSLLSALFGQAVAARDEGVSEVAVHDHSLLVPAAPSIGASTQSLYGSLA
jgi:hypothetical protein